VSQRLHHYPELVRIGRRALEHPGIAIRRSQALLSPSVLYIDRHRDISRSAILFSSARSGSTLLARVLCQGPRRLVFEPMRGDRVPTSKDIHRGQYVDPSETNSELATALDPILTGRVRSLWSDTYNRARLPTSRLIKEIRATNLTPWIARAYPDVPLIFLLRHPIATANSAFDLGWTDVLARLLLESALLTGPIRPWRQYLERAAVEDSGSLVAMVVWWCLEHLAPLTMLRQGEAHVIFYEDLLRYPIREFDRMSRYLEARNPAVWAGWQPTEGGLGWSVANKLSRLPRTVAHSGRAYVRLAAASRTNGATCVSDGTERRGPRSSVRRRSAPPLLCRQGPPRVRCPGAKGGALAAASEVTRRARNGLIADRSRRPLDGTRSTAGGESARYYDDVRVIPSAGSEGARLTT
jgi:Sulfotransferase family